MRLHIAGVSIKAWGNHVKKDRLKENQELFKITPSMSKTLVLGQDKKSEVTADKRESQTSKIDCCRLFRSTSCKQRGKLCKGTARLSGCILCDAPSKLPHP